MTLKTMLTLMVAGTLLVAGCSKKEETTSQDTPPPPPAAEPAAADNPAAGGVAQYDDMVPQGGTKRTLQNFTVFQAADPGSTVLTRLAPGTLINLKGSHGNWMLIEWPSGVGQLSLGWIELRANDSRVAEATPAPATTTTTSAATTASAAPTTSAPPAESAAPATSSTGRGTIKLLPNRKN